MVKSENGMVTINGNSVEILADMCVLLHGVRVSMANSVGEDKARELIIDIVNDSLKSEEELFKKYGGNKDGKSISSNKQNN